MWVRNGLGDLSKASVEKRIRGSQVAVLRLEKALPFDPDFTVADRDPFPGSVAFTVEYVESSAATPSWPLLTGGFLGSVSPDGAQRGLGIEMAPGARGGPVFDAGGRLVGLAVRTSDGTDRIVIASQLRAGVGERLGSSAASAGRASVDRIYESALRTAVQVIK